MFPYKRFNSAADLTSLLYDSLIEYLEDRGIIQSKPFDAAPCRGADLADGDGVTNAAILLFGADPQKHAPAAVVKCAHYHGIEVAKPIPSHQVFEGTLFEQVDDAVDFVMSKLARSVGTRAASAAAPVKYEMPKEAIHEIIVNAVAHRDYTSNAAVQVSVFADRAEIWNPGSLPRGVRAKQPESFHGGTTRRKSLRGKRKRRNAGSSYSRRLVLTRLTAEIPPEKSAPRTQPFS